MHPVMRTCFRRCWHAMLSCWVLGLFMAGFVAGANAVELRMITSYQPDMFDPMLEAFGQEYPDIRIRVLNKNTNAAVDEVLAGNERGFDLFWASAPEAFAVLEKGDRLLDLGHGPYADFAWSAIGWTSRADRGRPLPQDWNDLLDPAFAQDIAMSHPMRSGTMHSLIETILQDRGWHAGWAWILELAGQLNTISARSFGVLEGVESGDFSIGLTIDFLALTREGLEFRYGRPVILIPARIAALKDGAEPEAARKFIDFVLSPPGQRVLLRPDVRRIPVDPAIRAEAAASLDPAVEAALNFSWSRYDPELAARRYWQVKQIFEAYIARDLLLRRELWRRLRALEDAPKGASRAEVARIRRLLTWMPLTEYQARSARLDRETLLLWSERSHAILLDVEALISGLEQP